METPKQHLLVDIVSILIFFSDFVVFHMSLIYSASLPDVHSFAIHNHKIKNNRFLADLPACSKTPSPAILYRTLQIQTKVIYRGLEKHSNRRKQLTKITKLQNLTEVLNIIQSVFGPQLLKQAHLQINDHKLLPEISIASSTVLL